MALDDVQLRTTGGWPSVVASLESGEVGERETWRNYARRIWWRVFGARLYRWRSTDTCTVTLTFDDPPT